MKKIICILLSAFIILTTACTYKSESNVKINVNGENVVDAKSTFDTDAEKPIDVEVSTGGFAKINFGHQNDKALTWLVIYEDETSEVLLSEKVLDVKKYNEKEGEVNWENSTLYEYLNSDFINEYFSNEEKSKMIFTNDEDDDLATMLSINNLLDLYGDMNYVKDGYYGDAEFFEANKKIVAKPTDTAIFNEIDVFDNEVMAEIMKSQVDKRYDFANGCVGYWILNQPEDGIDNAFFVTSTGYIGYIPVNTDYIGIRPVIRIKKN